MDKAERFKSLAEKRVNSTVKKLRLIANLGNKHNYQYTESEARQICTAIEKEVKRVRMAFIESSQQEDDSFKFKSTAKRIIESHENNNKS